MTHRILGALSALALAASLGGCASNTDELGTGSDELRLACGGFAGFECPDGYRCVDDPRDSCDPRRGGADCIGVCAAIVMPQIITIDGLESNQFRAPRLKLLRPLL